MLNKQILMILVCGVLIGGCKGSSDSNATADTSPPTSTAGATSDTATKPDAGADTAKADDSTKPADASSGDNSTKILGVWDNPVPPKAKSSSYDFKDDGTAVVTVIAESPSGKGTMTIITNETWKVDGDKLTMKPVSANMDTDDESAKAGLATAKKQVNDKLKDVPDSTGEIKWDGDDSWSAAMTTPAFSGNPEQKLTIKMAKHKE